MRCRICTRMMFPVFRRLPSGVGWTLSHWECTATDIPDVGSREEEGMTDNADFAAARREVNDALDCMWNARGNDAPSAIARIAASKFARAALLKAAGIAGRPSRSTGE